MRKHKESKEQKEQKEQKKEQKNTHRQTSRLENPEKLQLHHNHEKFL
jgi:hypothetical protein